MNKTPSLAETLGWTLAALAFFLPLSIAGINAGLGLATLLLLARTARGEGPSMREAACPASWALAAYAAVGLVSGLAGLDPLASLKLWPKDIHKAWVLATLILALRTGSVRRVATGFAAGCAGAAVIGVYQALFIRAADGETWIRAHGFTHPVPYGEILALAGLGGLCLLFSPADAGRPRPRWTAALLVLFGAAFVLNQTRGAFVGLATGAVVVAVLAPALRRWLLWMGLAGIGVLAAWELLPTHRSLIGSAIEFGLEPVRNEQFDRMVLWRVAWNAFRDHPLLGVGPGNYRTVFPDYFSGILEGERIWGAAHNLYLNQLAERGVAGLAALLGVFWTLGRRALERARREATPLNLWSIACIPAFMTMCLTEDAFEVEQVATVLLFIWAWAEAEHRSRSAELPAA